MVENFLYGKSSYTYVDCFFSGEFYISLINEPDQEIQVVKLKNFRLEGFEVKKNKNLFEKDGMCILLKHFFSSVHIKHYCIENKSIKN